MLGNFRHGLNGAVASLAIHSSGDVSTVIEFHVVRKHVNLDPRNGLPIVISFAHFLNVWAVSFDNQMTVHAGAESRNVCMITAFNLIVTVLTLDLVLPHMDTMIKGNWLVWRIALIVADSKLEFTAAQD